MSGIEKRLAENHQKTHESISQVNFMIVAQEKFCFQAFEDMTHLMDGARDMVALSKGIAEKLRARKGEISEDEV